MSAQKIDPFSPLGMYGDEVAFAKRKEEGYTEVFFGGGPWIDNDTRRIVAIWVFRRPDGRKVATHETHKFRDEEGYTNRASSEREMSPDDFDKFVADWKLKMISARLLLAEVLELMGR